MYTRREAKKLYFKIEEWAAGRTLEQYLRQQLQLTRAQIRSLKFQPEGLCINGQKARVTQQLQTGDELAVELEKETMSSEQLVPVYEPLEILYEDADLIAVWKPGGLVLHPSHGHYEDTLSNRLYGYMLEKKEKAVIRSIGRLDRDTSGIVVFAKNQIAAARLWQQKEEGRFWKEYLAVCQGSLVPEQAAADDKKQNREQKDADWYTIDTPIGPKEGTLMQMCVRSDGQRAVTHYQILQRNSGHTVIRVRIETGRTHQIRVHMASIGYPLVGDCLYGNQDTELQLYAWKCQLEQPFSGETITLSRTVSSAFEGLTEHGE